MQNAMGIAVSVVEGLAANLPTYLVWIAGIVLAIMMRDRCRRASLLAGLAFTMFLVSSAISVVLYRAVFPSFYTSFGGMRVPYMILAIVSSFGSAIAHGLLLAAVFLDRGAGDPDAVG